MFRSDRLGTESTERGFGAGWIVPGLFLFDLWNSSIEHRLDESGTQIFRINNRGKVTFSTKDEDARDSPRVECFEGSEVIIETHRGFQRMATQHGFHLPTRFVADREKLDRFAGKLGSQRVQCREGGDTRAAPGRPEIHNHHFAA